jgi:hypothetical protein
LINAVRNARGRFVVQLADDDALIAETLMGYVDRMQRESDLAAIYADWIAYDDQQKREIHRYFRFPQPACFETAEPLALVNFVLENIIWPEVAVYRREALLRSDCIVERGVYPLMLWLYRLSRRGRIAFELAPFYRENRILESRFQRQYWSSESMRFQLIGDEYRNALETLLLWALQDSGASRVPDDMLLTAKTAIDRFLHYRTGLEVQRAVAAKNWLLASELSRRLVLWNGPGSPETQRSDVLNLTVPAALQLIQETYRNLSDVGGLVLHGFHGRMLPEFFAQHYPDLKLLDEAEASVFAGAGRLLHLYKHDPATDGASSGYHLYLDRLLENCRLHALFIDIDQL